MSKLRPITIMIEHSDPCHVCTFKEQCSNYGGCMGWTPDDADKSEIMTLKAEINKLRTRELTDPRCADNKCARRQATDFSK